MKLISAISCALMIFGRCAPAAASPTAPAAPAAPAAAAAASPTRSQDYEKGALAEYSWRMGTAEYARRLLDESIMRMRKPANQRAAAAAAAAAAGVLANQLMRMRAPAREESIDAYIRQILEQLKEKMPTGIPELGVPVLDPFAVPHFDIPHISTDPAVEIDLKIDDLVITNLATFETSNVKTDLSALTLDLGLHIPMLRADATYDLDGTVLGFIPIYGNGPCWIEIYEMEITGTASVVIDAEGYLQVSSLVLSADFDGIKLHFDNLLGGDALGETLNNLLSALGTQIWDMVKDTVFDSLNSALKDVINDALKFCTIQDIIANACQ